MSRLETRSPSGDWLLESRTLDITAYEVYERRPARVPWRTPFVIPAMLVLFAATVLSYVFAVQ